MMDNTVRYKSEYTVSKFHASNAFVRGIRGPRGSGKSVGCCAEIFRRGVEQEPWNGVRKTRFALIRNTYPELKTTTVKTWEDWFADYTRMTYSSPITGHLRLPLKDKSVVEQELFFVSLDKPKDIRKLKSLELTGAFLNEASEMNKDFLDMLTASIPRYPAKWEGGATWSGIIMDTNAMDDDHWWYNLAEIEKPEGYEFFEQPTALLAIPPLGGVTEGKIDTAPDLERYEQWLNDNPHIPSVYHTPSKTYYVPNPKAENSNNLTGGPVYWLKQVPGKRKEWIDVFVMNRYGMIAEGRPVYPEYQDEIHCAKEILDPVPGVAITLGWDFGLTPACSFMQLLPNGYVNVFDELYVPLHAGMGIRQFASQIVRPYILERFQPWIDKRLFQSYGDPAGTAMVQTDEMTCLIVLNELFLEEGIVSGPGSTQSLIARQDAVSRFLLDYPDGSPRFRLSPRCDQLRKGFRGKYHYSRVQVASDERYRDIPHKNIYSHIHEALQYGMLRAYLDVYKEEPRQSEFDKRINELEQGNKGSYEDYAGYHHLREMKRLQRGELISTIKE